MRSSVHPGAQAPPPRSARSPIGDDGQLAARQALRRQIARLERELADAFVSAYPLGGLGAAPPARDQVRLLDLAELEQVRDELVQRVRTGRATIERRRHEVRANQVRLELMLREPHKHRFAQISSRDVGRPGCRVWRVAPRLGPIGMLKGWWQVRVSSGCPLARGPGPAPRS
jgi:hypothetical protein